MQQERFPPEWKEMVGVCAKLARKEIAPGALEADQGSRPDFVNACMDRLAAVGVTAVLVPEAQGGAGLEPLLAALALDAVGGGCASVAAAAAYHLAAQTALAEAGPGAAEGLLPATLGPGPGPGFPCTCILPRRFAEPEGAAGPLAAREASGGLVLDGAAGLVPGAGRASLLVVFAPAAPASGSPQVACAAVPPGLPGVEVGEAEAFGGLRALSIHPVAFHQVRLAPEHVLCRPGSPDGERVLARTRHVLRVLLSAAATGLGRSAFDQAFGYACQRYQYGKIIARHQEIQRMLGRMLSHLEAAAALYMQALSGAVLDTILCSPRGESVKAFCTEAALRAAVDAVQIHGGYGYMQDYGVEKLMRDAKMLQLLEGSGPVLEIEAAGRRVEEALG